MKQILLLLLISCSFSSKAQWSSDPNVADTKVFTGENAQDNSYVVADGNGGVIVFWQSYNSWNNYSIHYNHLNSNGVADWASVTTGINLTTHENFTLIDQVISDDKGGAFISWFDERDGSQVFVQHISSTGVQLWNTGGIAIGENGYQGFICKDGNGGIIVAWLDDQYDHMDNFPRTYAQRISAEGSPLWAAGGVRVLNTNSFDICLGIVSDGAGGVILMMADTRSNVNDHRTGENSNLDIYAQKLDALGAYQWAATGVPVCVSPKSQYGEIFGSKSNNIVSDGAGGAIFAWEDYRNDPDNGNAARYNSDIFAQKINSSGVAQWAADGVVVCNAVNEQEGLFMMADGASGVVITWLDRRLNYSLYTQKLNGSGTPQWTLNGKLVATNQEFVEYSAAADESGNNLLLTWLSPYNPPPDIRVQKVRISDGAFLWGSGTIICSRPEGTMSPSIANNGAGGAIISWTDQRAAIEDGDIYANRALSNGTLPVNFIDFSANAQGADVWLDWATATESNSQYFGIQKSVDGIQFNETWKVNAAGNSNTERHYQYIDAKAFANSPVLYYRISETDRDGKIIYSVIRQVKNPDGLFQKIKLVANPVKSDARIEYFSSTGMTAGIKILDQQGRSVLSSSVNIFKGNNQFLLSTRALPAGIYTIILSGKVGISKLKMMKE